MSNFKRLQLKNGLRVIFVPQESSLATTVIVLVEAGSKYESKDINGLSHFLEHMCFKGTKNRPRAIDIASELDGLGAQYNAFTSQEFTSYFVKARNSATHKILEVIADLYLNPVFDPKEIEKEKGVIIEEINMYEDLPSRKVQELFMELVYHDQPAGWSVAGRKEVIRSLNQDDFLKYRKGHYLAQATIVVVAGSFEEEIVTKDIASYFAVLPKTKKGLKPKVKEAQTKPEELVKHKESDQTHLVLGFRAFDIFDKRRFALQVLADILGGGMSSRLFQKIREEMAAAYYVHVGADLYSDHGLLAMSAGIKHEKIEDVITASLKEFARVREKGVSKTELGRAKEHLVGNLFLSLETSDELGYFYGGEEVMGLPLTTPEVLARKIQAVTIEDLREVAKAILQNNRLNLALIGPFKDKTFRKVLGV